MRRYYLQLAIRSDPQWFGAFECEEDQLTRVVKCNVTAYTEQIARRTAMERAWASHCLITEFISIEARELA